MPLVLQAAVSNDDWFKDPITSATTVIALAAIASLIISALMWRVTSRYTKITRDIFEASHRPYVCVALVEFKNDTDAKQLRLVVRFTNVGSVPAYNFRNEQAFMLTEKEGLTLPDIEGAKSYILYPQVPVDSTTILANLTDYNLISKSNNLGLTITTAYQGVSRKKYGSVYKAVFDKDRNMFAKLSETETSA